MSAAAPRELKILVERVVRQLPIPLSRQKRLRSELLEHLQSLYDEELKRDDNVAAAMERAKQRFGDPVELTAELRKSTSLWERWGAWCQSLSAQGRHESLLRYTARFVGPYILFMAVVMGLIMADHHFFGTERFSWLKIRVGAAALTFLVIWVSCFLLLGLQSGIEWERPRRRWDRILLLWLGLVASWPASLLLMMQLAGGSWADYSMPLISSLVGGCFSAVCGTFLGVFHRRDTLYRREWAELDLGIPN